MESIRSLIADEGILDQASSYFSIISASEVGMTPYLPSFVDHACSVFKSGHCAGQSNPLVHIGHCQKYIFYTAKQLEHGIKKRMKSGNDIKYTELTFAVLWVVILLIDFGTC